MRIGVLGSMVWDRIDHPDAAPVERWGGISYSLAAAAAALPDGWSVRPIVKVGRDLATEARAFLSTLPGLETGDGVLVVDEPNNRVRLRYRDRHHRDEHLTGGVPGWRWDELAPRVDGLDGLFVNLISGFELELDVAERLRAAYGGPLYADFHSLLLGTTRSGPREPRPLAGRDRWLAAFDVVQVNEQELALVAGEEPAWTVAERAVASGLGALLVTLGPRGAAWLARADSPFQRRAPGDGSSGPGGRTESRVRRGEVPAERTWGRGDPTGCGDVWGATCFVALMQGERLTAAMASANRAAARNVAHRGADGLYQQLRARA